MTDFTTDPNSSVKKVTWEEEDPSKWLSAEPSIEVIYDCLLDLVDYGAIDKRGGVWRQGR